VTRDQPTEGSTEAPEVETLATEGQPAHHGSNDSTIAAPQDARTAAPNEETDFELPRVGEHLADRFTVLRLIARGGTGAVYEASDELLRTRIALRVIRGSIGTDATSLERFRREVLLARRVSHPNVCRVYELYEATTAAGVPIRFLTMELLGGESLASRLARTGRFTATEALVVVRQMCEGLAAAHAEGVIHGDFKSNNVMLVPRATTTADPLADSTRVVITDFGLAPALDVASKEPRQEVTGVAGTLGTSQDMEHVAGVEVTASSDIHALGVVLYEMVTGTLPFVADTPPASRARRLAEAPPRPDTLVPGLDGSLALTILRCLDARPERRFDAVRDILPALEAPARTPRTKLTLLVSVLLLLPVAAYAVVRLGPHLHWQHAQPKPAFAAQRPLVAILGFRSALPSKSPSWLPTAITELLAHELSAAEKSLRLSGTDEVALALQSLGVSADELAEEKSQARIVGLLGADVLVHGTLAPRERDSPDVVLHVEALDAQTRQRRTAFDVDLGPDGARLIEELSDTGARLRKELGVSLSSEETTALSVSRVPNLDAARLYAEGVQRYFEDEEARSYFEAALSVAPNFLDARRRIAETRGSQGDRKQTLEAWQRVRAHPEGLTARGVAEVDARLLALGPDAEKAREARMALFEAVPDDFDLAVELLGDSSPQVALALTRRLRHVHGPQLALDRWESSWLDLSGDHERAQELLARVMARSKELGARRELAWTYYHQGNLFYRAGRVADALPWYRDAERTAADAGFLPLLANAISQRAGINAELGRSREALRGWDEEAALWRRLGNRGRLVSVFLVEGRVLGQLGEVDLAGEKLEQARVELEALGEPIRRYLVEKADVAFFMADLRSVRELISRLRSGSDVPLRLEAAVLVEEDRLEQARSSFLEASKNFERNGNQLMMFAAAVNACAVDCSGAHPAAGAACLADLCRSWSHAVPGTKANCLVQQALCSYRMRDLAAAEKSAREALAVPGMDEEDLLGALGAATSMRIAAARGDASKAIPLLRGLLSRLESKHARLMGFEVALALGEAELRAGQSQGRVRLLRLEQEARSRECLRLARLAREALAGESQHRTQTKR